MTKFKSQNEVDMEDFNDNKPSQKWLDWFQDVFDFSKDEDTKGFWLATGLIFIMVVVIIGFIMKML